MAQSDEMDASDSRPATRWYHRIGPGLITACVVIGPGSILTSSKVGAANGFALWWVVALAVVFMMVYTSLGAKLGVVASESPGTLVTDRAGRWLAALIGIGVFFISAAFQFGNNLGVASAFAVYLDKEQSWYLPALVGLVILFNTAAISFLYVFRNLYKAVERLMMVFVGLMLVSFAANLVFALTQMPTTQPESNIDMLDISNFGLFGTTFVITAAFFQAYLVRQKGWHKGDLANGLVDARVGAVIMALITLMIMSTAAAVLRGKKLDSAIEVAQQLRPLFGEGGQALFCLGLFSAAYSSFLVNSMIGGFILSDGLGLGSKPTEWWPKFLTSAVLVTGMSVAIMVLAVGVSSVPAIVSAQAVTVVAAPLVAGSLLWLTSRKDIMGKDVNQIPTIVLGTVGFLMLLGISYYLITVGIPTQLEKLSGN